jgi:hypothetical protein
MVYNLYHAFISIEMDLKNGDFGDGLTYSLLH